MKTLYNKIIFFIALILLINSVTPISHANYSDISGHWAENTIKSITDYKLVTGLPDGTFKPDLVIPRDQFITLMVRIISKQQSIGKFDEDALNSGYWAAKYIDKAKELGIIKTNHFGDESINTLTRAITRGEMIDILVKLIPILNIPLDKEPPVLTDVATLTEPMRSNVIKVLKTGLIKGYSNNTIAVNDNMSRAQVATLVYNIYNIANNINKEIEPEINIGQSPKPTDNLDAIRALKLGEPAEFGSIIPNSKYTTYNNITWIIIHNGSYKNEHIIAVNQDNEIIAVQKDLSRLNLDFKASSPGVRISTTDSHAYLRMVDEHDNDKIIFEFEVSHSYFAAIHNAPTNAQQERDFEKMTAELMNIYRVKSAGLSPLKSTDKGSSFAREYSQRMKNENFFSHTDPSGETFNDRVKKSSIKASYYAENIAYGHNNPLGLVFAWISSHGHRENIRLKTVTVNSIGITTKNTSVIATQILYNPN